MRALLAILAVGATACGSILGLQEPTVDDAIEAGGDGSPQGEGGPNAPVVVAQNQGGPFMVAEFGSRVVWTNFLGSTVSSVRTESKTGSLSSCRSRLYASGRPFSVVSRPVTLPIRRPALPRASSAMSGFFFCGMIDDPVE